VHAVAFGGRGPSGAVGGDVAPDAEDAEDEEDEDLGVEAPTSGLAGDFEQPCAVIARVTRVAPASRREGGDFTGWSLSTHARHINAGREIGLNFATMGNRRRSDGASPPKV